ncbi:MAG: cell division protein FtsL [Thermoleophilaceae bacterium]
MGRAATAAAAAPARRAPTGRARAGAAAPARKPAPPRAVPSRRRPAARPAPGRPASARGRAIVRRRGAAALDALLHGPALIALVFVLLVGVVFANVALLQKNREITRDAARVTELKRDNASLRRDVAELGSTERIRAVAAERGLVLPAPDQVRYLRSTPQVDARNAANQLDEVP